MRRIIPVGILITALGCSNAPIAGTLDAIWPARGSDPPRERDRGNNDRSPLVPDVRPPGPGTRPAPAAPSTDALPPPADLFAPPKN